MHCRSALERYSDYFIWSFGREPLQRIASAFKMGLRGSRLPKSRQPSFDDFFTKENLGHWTPVSSAHWKSQTKP
eukprot:UN18297